MKTTDFAQCLASYLTMYLPGQLGLSENTIMAYRDTFKLITRQWIHTNACRWMT